MAKEQGVRDRFANVASIQTVMSAANVLTYNSLNTNMGFLGRRDQALAMIIDEIQYLPSLAALTLMDSDNDSIEMALSDSTDPTDLADLTDRRIIDYTSWQSLLTGAVVSQAFIVQPARKQFFPPLITAARTLQLGINSAGLANPVTGSIKILYRVETLTGAELVELSEVFRLTG